MLPVARHNVFYHEAAVHERDDGLDSELWCTGNRYVFTKKVNEEHPPCSMV
jgi:hypothetical protein